jgi:uncharacterized protein
MILRKGDPLANEATQAIRGGSLEALQRMLADHPGLSGARIGDARGSGVLLHVVTDWPGFFPNGPAVVKLLIAAGADPNARTEGAKNEEGETPLQYAASNDDVEVAEALVLGGADLNWIPDYAKETPLEIASSSGLDTGREALVNWLRDKGARGEAK